MKTLIFGYFDLNFGDDWLIHQFCHLYKKENVILVVSDDKLFSPYKNYKKYTSIKNVGKLKSLTQSDEIYIIGGSMFQQGSNWITHYSKLYLFISIASLLRKKTYIYGCNITPPKSKYFKFLISRIFKHTDHFLVRDYTSKKTLIDEYHILNKHIELNLDLADKNTLSLSLKKSNQCAVSIINNSQIDEKNYFTWLKNKILDIQKNNINIVFNLFSFDCGRESDNSAIKKFIQYLHTENININYTIYLYDGDIYKFINHWQICKIAICTRFHSYILARNSNQSYSIYGYSDKIRTYIETHHPQDLPFLYVP